MQCCLERASVAANKSIATRCLDEESVRSRSLIVPKFTCKKTSYPSYSEIAPAKICGTLPKQPANLNE